MFVFWVGGGCEYLRSPEPVQQATILVATGEAIEAEPVVMDTYW